MSETSVQHHISTSGSCYTTGVYVKRVFSWILVSSIPKGHIQPYGLSASDRKHGRPSMPPGCWQLSPVSLARSFTAFTKTQKTPCNFSLLININILNIFRLRIWVFFVWVRFPFLSLFRSVILLSWLQTLSFRNGCINPDQMMYVISSSWKEYASLVAE